MNRHFILFALASAAALSGVAKTFDVDISTGRPAASNEAYYHGETIEFRAVRGRSVVTNVEYSCVYYQTNGMDSVWWETDGLVFHPTNDVGAASYRFFLEGRDEIGRDWHANGTIRMLPSPGFTPNAIELPVRTLDFATVEVSNAPWLEIGELATGNGERLDALEPQVATNAADIAALGESIDYTTSNATLVATIEATAPAPGNYAAVSNAAMTALQEHQSLANYYNKTETESKIVELAPAPYTTPPQMAGTASPGSSAAYARGDHVHPAETALGYTPGQPYFPAGFFPCSLYDHTDVWTWDSADANGIPNDPELPTLGPLSLQDTTYQSQAVIGLFSRTTELAFFDKDSGALLGVAEPNYTGFSRGEIGIAPPVLSSVSVRGVEVAQESDVEAHTSNTTIHVTAEDKASWNGKLDASDLPYALGTALTPDANDAIQLANHTVNLFAPTSAIDPLVIKLPASIGAGLARDCFLRIDLTNGLASLANVSFANADGTAAVVETPGGSYPTMKDGKVTILYISETAAGRWIIKSETVEVAS